MVCLSTSRDFPFPFSAAARLELGSPESLNLVVLAAFPEQAAGWANRTGQYFGRGLTGPSVVIRAGPAGTVLGLFAGMIIMGDEPDLCPRLLACAADQPAQFGVLSLNFDLHGEPDYTLSHVQALAWRRDGHSAAHCC